jgi:hypothetical protein
VDRVEHVTRVIDRRDSATAGHLGSRSRTSMSR